MWALFATNRPRPLTPPSGNSRAAWMMFQPCMTIKNQVRVRYSKRRRKPRIPIDFPTENCAVVAEYSYSRLVGLSAVVAICPYEMMIDCVFFITMICYKRCPTGRQVILTEGSYKFICKHVGALQNSSN